MSHDGTATSAAAAATASVVSGLVAIPIFDIFLNRHE
jgi:hypothetical protein